MIIRVGFNLFVFASFLFAPWQSSVLFLLAGFFLYEGYWEGLVWAGLLDTVSADSFFSAYWYSLFACTSFVVAAWAKPYIWLYK